MENKNAGQVLNKRRKKTDIFINFCLNAPKNTTIFFKLLTNNLLCYNFISETHKIIY
jgi:hypothetical protein